MDIDKGNNIVITEHLANLISGSDLKLKNFGEHSLKGIEGNWSLLEVYE